MLHSQPVEPQVTLVAMIKRQRRWAGVFTTVGVMAVLAIARYFNPHPLPFLYVAPYALLAIVVILRHYTSGLSTDYSYSDRTGGFSCFFASRDC